MGRALWCGEHMPPGPADAFIPTLYATSAGSSMEVRSYGTIPREDRPLPGIKSDAIVLLKYNGCTCRQGGFLGTHFADERSTLCVFDRNKSIFAPVVAFFPRSPLIFCSL